MHDIYIVFTQYHTCGTVLINGPTRVVTDVRVDGALVSLLSARNGGWALEVLTAEKLKVVMLAVGCGCSRGLGWHGCGTWPYRLLAGGEASMKWRFRLHRPMPHLMCR
jgi:hypothetical protein